MRQPGGTFRMHGFGVAGSRDYKAKRRLTFTRFPDRFLL